MPRLLKLPEVMSITGLSRSSIYAFIQQEKFPSPVSLGARAVAWVEPEINEWIQNKIQKREV
ncbi:MAG: AlpA family transcriptional regulator [Pseudomonadota bacterium]